MGISILGLEIHLVKYGIGKVTQGLKDKTNAILGHYDSLSINPINNWLDFSVENTMSVDDNCQEGKFYAKNYPIKLLFPREETIFKFKEFNYSEWENYEHLLKNNSCVTLTLVNLTDAYKKKVEKNILEGFLNLILGSIHINKKLLKKVNFIAMPSLGYSDFCLLTCDTEWKSTMELIEHLHGLIFDEYIPVLSTDYMIPAYQFNNKHFDSSCFNEIGMSVRVNLRPGITAQILKNAVPPSVEVYRTSGSTDCLLRAKGTQAPNELCEFLMFSNGESTIPLVVDMESTLQFSIEGSGDSGIQLSDKLNQCVGTNDVLKELQNQIKNYRDILCKNDRHLQQLNNLNELYTNIRNIYEECHTGLVCNILEGFISNFTTCLDLCIKDAEKDESESKYPFDEIEKQVCEFCTIVNEFLLNLSRSDCFFIEKERHNHSSVSATASLLIAYNQWLNAFAQEVRKVTQPKSKSDFKFLITSGGQGETVTKNSFYFLNHQPPEQKKLSLIIRMAETSPFDFAGTIIRSSHECMHFCGERYRKKRADLLVSFVASMLSKTISEELFSKNNTYGYVAEICSVLCPNIEGYDELLHQSEQIYGRCLCNFETIIYDRLVNCFNKTELETENDYLSENIERWMYNSLLKTFSVYRSNNKDNSPMEIGFNDFFIFLYEQTQEVHRRFYKDNDCLLSNNNVDTLVFEFDYDKTKLYSSVSNEYEMDFILKNQIQLVLSRLLISRFPNLKKSDEKDFEKNFPLSYMVQNNISDTLEVSIDIFSETFSDVMACKILDASLIDYLMAQAYEDSDIENALPVDPTNYYRFSAVINLCFKDNLNDDYRSLNEKTKKEISEAIINLQKHGKRSVPKPEILYNRISEFLNHFQDNFSIAQYLYDYLKYCEDEYKAMDAFSKLSRFSDTFKEIRLLNIEPLSDETNENIIKMYYALIYNKFGKGDGSDGEELPTNNMQEMAKTR